MKFLTPKAVCAMTSLSRGTLDRAVQDGEFPKPFRITNRRLAYRADEVEAWMSDKEQRRETLMQELADEAQELGLGYGPKEVDYITSGAAKQFYKGHDKQNAELSGRLARYLKPDGRVG